MRHLQNEVQQCITIKTTEMGGGWKLRLFLKLAMSVLI